MKTFKQFYEETIYEMALKRKGTESKLSYISSETVEHICKVITDPSNISANHWMKEVYNWCNKASNIKLKTNNKPPKKQDIIKWLFDTSIDSSQKTKFKNNIEGIIGVYNLDTKYNNKMWNQYLKIREDLAELISKDIVSLKDVFNIFEKNLKD